jgi:hypothetical protein
MAQTHFSHLQLEQPGELLVWQPSHAPQSAEQDWQSSWNWASHWPLPQHWPQSPGQLLQFSKGA